MSFNEFLSFLNIDRHSALTNFDIMIICEKINIQNFKGVFMRDEIKGKASNNESIILNLDESRNSGTHWVSLAVKNKICYYFDSYGFCPPDEIKSYCDGLECYFSSYRVQKPNELICGHYSVYMLYLLDKGISFNKAINFLYK